MVRRHIIIDANLLILLVVGTTDLSFITQHKRLRQYNIDAYGFLLTRISGSRKLLVTPNVLTEVSNLLQWGPEPYRNSLMMTLAALIGGRETSSETSIDEHYVASVQASKRPEFLRLGLTDAAMLSLGDSTTTLLTDDFDLYDAALRNGQDVEYFTHSRANAGFL